MNIFRKENIIVLEQDYNSLITQGAIIAFFEKALIKMSEEFVAKYIEEHKEELLNNLNHDKIIKMIELEIVKKFITK